MPKKRKTSRKSGRLRFAFGLIRNFISIIINRKVAPIIVISALGAWIYYSGEYDKFISQVDNSQNIITNKLGITVKDILLSGQVNTSAEDILDIFKNPDIYIENEKQNHSLFNIDLAKAKEELEKLVWVHYASIERQYPSTISVNIIEYKPVALWQKNGKVHIINEEGKIVPENNISKFNDLIIMVGQGVPSYANSLLKIINSTPQISGMVSSAIRISNRRWDIKLNNGIRIKLPENSPEKAWEYLAKTHDETGILDSDLKQIDLRVEDKMFVL